MLSLDFVRFLQSIYNCLEHLFFLLFLVEPIMLISGIPVCCGFGMSNFTQPCIPLLSNVSIKRTCDFLALGFIGM